MSTNFLPLDRLAALRDELNVGAARAKFVAGRLAMDAQADPVPTRELLKNLRDSLVPGDDDEATAAALIVALRIDSHIANREGRKRPTQMKWEEALARARRAEARLGSEHPEARRFRRLEINARGLIPEKRREAIAEYRSQLIHLGYPELHNFAISSGELQLARLLRDEDAEGVAEAREIVQKCLTWREVTYGDGHPFTLVALAHLVLVELEDLERVLDNGVLDAADIERAKALTTYAAKLSGRRIQVFGENHRSTILAISHEARVARLRGDDNEALILANQALTRFGGEQKTRRDAIYPHIMRIIRAEVLRNRTQQASRHAYAAQSANEQEPGKGRFEILRRVERLEGERAAALEDEVLSLLETAIDGIQHQLTAEPWVLRARRVQESLRLDR